MSCRRAPRVDPDRFPPCPACGVRYVDWRGEYPGGFARALSGHKASAWALHCERCEDYPAAALDFAPASFADPDKRTACVDLGRVHLGRDASDDWGAELDDVAEGEAVCLAVAWAAREALARAILGADYMEASCDR